MLSKADIQSEVYRVAFQKGEELYKEKKVQDLQYRLVSEHKNPTSEIHARVLGSKGEHIYPVTIMVDEEYDTINSYSCECEMYQTEEGMCKHCVAALLEYIGRRTAREVLDVRWDKEEKAGELRKKGTTADLKSVIIRYGMRNNSEYLIPEDIYGKIEVEPNLEISYGTAKLEFKIGMQHKYVIKNIPDFVNAIQNTEKVRYGKKLEFYHNIQAFTPESRKLINFIFEQDEEQKRQRASSFQYYVNTPRFDRDMRLDEAGIDAFFGTMTGLEFNATIDMFESKRWTVHEEEKKPALSIIGEASGVTLRMEVQKIIHGAKRDYICEDGNIYPIAAETKKELEDFIHVMERQDYRMAYVAENEMPTFCRDMLPLIQNAFQVETTDFNQDLYLPPKPEFELYIDRSPSDIVAAKLMVIYGDEKFNVLEKPELTQKRDIPTEIKIKNAVELYFNGFDQKSNILLIKNDEEMLYNLISGGLRNLSEIVTIYASESFRKMKVVPSPTVSVGVALKSDLLEMSIHSDQMPMDQLAYLLSKYDRKKKFVRLKNGDFLNVHEDGLEILAELREGLHLTEKQMAKGQVIIPKYRAMYLDASLKDKQFLNVDKNKEFKAMVRNMKTIEDSDYEVPQSLKPIMREYQKNGFLWLKTLRQNGFGGILADDMGLGKTLQVISLLVSEYDDRVAAGKELGRSLVVCPASLVYNWKKEMERFAPQLHAVTVTGLAPERKTIIESTKDGDVLITSYDLLKRDVEVYDSLVFTIQVIDEAQFIKNSNTQAAKAVKKIKAGMKLALTGTPIENRLSELWSIFDYLMPGFLYTYVKFREEIENPIVQTQDDTKMQRLQRMIRPFILRRLKKEVLHDLPEKIEENLYAKLEGEQQELYEANLQRMRNAISDKSDKEFMSERFQILAELTKLRQICCDPALVYEDYQGESAKMDMCIELIQNAVNGGHKILLFSQFTTMLEHIQVRLEKEGISYYTLTGSVNKEKRMKLVEQFNEDDTSVFCISLKAGGTGLNLTSADIVIHYDPWWNVAVQNQATDRAYRLGQENVVTVYKLVTEGTIEEKIVAIQEKKQKLAQEVLEGEGINSAGFSREELLQLLS
ncbi:MAG: SNF2 helicase associated domain-containing protein [Lachnospiraceae bacterium]